MPRTTYAAIVLGAGVVGCALSYHAARRGLGPVLLYDPATPGAGATGRAAGILTDQLWDRWDSQMVRETQEEYAHLCRRHDPAAFSENGFVRWTASSITAGAMEEAFYRLRRWGVHVDRVGSAELSAAFPWGRFEDVRLGLWSRSGATVTPSTVAELYLREGRGAGVETLFGTPMASLRWGPEGGELTVGSRRISAPTMVVAAGAWSRPILTSIGRPLPLVPYRTQAATLRPPGPLPFSFPSGHDVDADVYFRPEGAGRILAGNGTEAVEADPDRFVPQGDDRFLLHLAQSFAHRLPGWAACDLVRAWAGVCTATPDRRPLIGPVPGRPGLFVIAGFNGFGVMRAGAVARRLADLLVEGEGGRAAEELAPLSPARFGSRIGAFPPRPGFTLEAGEHPRC